MEILSERKRKRITTDSGNSDRSDDGETDASLNEEIKVGSYRAEAYAAKLPGSFRPRLF